MSRFKRIAVISNALSRTCYNRAMITFFLTEPLCLFRVAAFGAATLATGFAILATVSPSHNRHTFPRSSTILAGASVLIPQSAPLPPNGELTHYDTLKHDICPRPIAPRVSATQTHTEKHDLSAFTQRPKLRTQNFPWSDTLFRASDRRRWGTLSRRGWEPHSETENSLSSGF